MNPARVAGALLLAIVLIPAAAFAHRRATKAERAAILAAVVQQSELTKPQAAWANRNDLGRQLGLRNPRLRHVDFSWRGIRPPAVEPLHASGETPAGIDRVIGGMASAAPVALVGAARSLPSDGISGALICWLLTLA